MGKEDTGSHGNYHGTSFLYLFLCGFFRLFGFGFGFFFIIFGCLLGFLGRELLGFGFFQGLFCLVGFWEFFLQGVFLLACRKEEISAGENT